MFNKIKELDSKNHMNIYSRRGLCFTHGEKSKLYDSAGKEYTDFMAGIAVNALGYNHPVLTEAIAEQAKKLIHISNVFYNEPQVTLGEKLLDGTFFDNVAFSNSGAEANELAIKLARKYFYEKKENRYKIVTALNSFHGRTLATVTATGQEKYSKPYAPLPGGFLKVPYNDFEALKDLVSSDDEIGAVMLECIQGESGVLPAKYEYPVNVYALLKSKGILLILDEVQTGMGRTGKMFCFEHFGIKPDIITLAKGLGGGVPIGAVLARGEVADAFSPGDHGSTFGGNPLATTAASVVVNELKNNGLLEKAESAGEYLAGKLAYFRKYNFVDDVRGMGLLQAVVLTPALKNTDVVLKLQKAGYIVNACGGNAIRICPPYIISNEEIDGLCGAMEAIFAATNI